MAPGKRQGCPVYYQHNSMLQVFYIMGPMNSCEYNSENAKILREFEWWLVDIFRKTWPAVDLFLNQGSKLSQV